MNKEELKSKYGINVDDLTYPHGEMNIIVQCFGSTNDEFNNDPSASPDIYHPRKNRVWSCACQGDKVSLSSENDRKDYIKHLKDSVGRLRIMAILLEKQAKELEEMGYIKTDCYFADLSEIGYEE